MIKKYLLLAVFITGCSSQNNSLPPSSNEENSSSDIVYDVSNLTVESTSVLPDPVPLMETNASTKEVSRVISFKNSGSSPFSMSLVQLTPSAGFSVKINRCGSSLTPGGSCQMTIAFSNRNLVNGTYNTGLQITNEVSLQLSASVSGLVNPAQTGAVVLSLSLNAPFNPLNNNPTRTLTIKNSGTGYATNVAASLPPEYVLKINHCSSILKPNQSCSMQVSLKNYRSGATVPETTISISSNDPSGGTVSKIISPKTGLIPPSDDNYLFDLSFEGRGFLANPGFFLADGSYVFKAEQPGGGTPGVFLIDSSSQVSRAFSVTISEYNNVSLSQMLSSRGYAGFYAAPTNGVHTGYVIDNDEKITDQGAACLFVESYGNEGDVTGNPVDYFEYEDMIGMGLTYNIGSDTDCYQFYVDYYNGYDPQDDGTIILAKYVPSLEFDLEWLYVTRFFPINDNHFLISGSFGKKLTLSVSGQTWAGPASGVVTIEKLIDQKTRLVKRSGLNQKCPSGHHEEPIGSGSCQPDIQ